MSAEVSQVWAWAVAPNKVPSKLPSGVPSNAPSSRSHSHCRPCRRFRSAISDRITEAMPKGKASAGILRAVKHEGSLNACKGCICNGAVRNQLRKNKALRRSTSGGKIRQAAVAPETGSRSRKWEILMPGTCRRVGLVILLAALAQTALAQTSAPAPAPTVARHHKSHRKTPKPLVLPPLPSGPLSQLPMDQIPPTPAKVSYQGGLLTISAQNSTLGEILRDVRKLTGASIDVPPGSAGTSERVIAHLGPGAPRDVLQDCSMAPSSIT